MKIFATGLLGGLLMAFLIGSVRAGEKTTVTVEGPPNALRVSVRSCADVRAVVAIVGKEEAERAARDAGASEKAIAWARSCLGS